MLRPAILLAAASILAPAFGQHEHHGAGGHAGHEQHDAAASSPKAVQPQSARIVVPDTALVDQQGRKTRLRSDALGDRIVVVDFVYTSCTTVCPVLSAVMAQVQDKLAAQPLRDVGLLTLTVDPVRDTPARLKSFAANLGAGPGWSWLTGPKPQVDEALKAFGAYTPNFADHPPLVLVGDARSGRWLRFYGFPTPDQLLGAVKDFSQARARAGGTS